MTNERSGVSRRTILVVSLAAYCAAIVGANWLIAHVGTPAGPGTHLLPVGFGLMAPSGVYAAGAAFVARDVVQRVGGRWWGIGVIVAGAALSAWVANPTLAIASGVTFLVSETADFAVYSPLQRRWFAVAVVASGMVGLVIDSVLFLHLAGIPFSAALPGLMLGKVWVILAAGPIAALLRRHSTLEVAT